MQALVAARKSSNAIHMLQTVQWDSLKNILICFEFTCWNSIILNFFPSANLGVWNTIDLACNIKTAYSKLYRNTINFTQRAMRLTKTKFKKDSIEKTKRLQCRIENNILRKALNVSFWN